MEKLKITKVRDVKTPTRANWNDAGIDFFVPNDLTVETMLEKEKITNSKVGFTCMLESDTIKEFLLDPGHSILIPSGIKVRIPRGFALIFFNKSGVASKLHLDVGATVVDESYTGECHIHLTNVGTERIIFKPGDKIVQGILIPVYYSEVEEVQSEEELYKDFETSRGSGGFGSTGTK